MIMSVSIPSQRVGTPNTRLSFTPLLRDARGTRAIPLPYLTDGHAFACL